MLRSLDQCKSYASLDKEEATYRYNLFKYRGVLASKVDNLCLEMGYLCGNDKARYERLDSEIKKEIDAITSDESEKQNLDCYVHRMIRVGRNYLTLTQGY